MMSEFVEKLSFPVVVKWRFTFLSAVSLGLLLN